MDKEAKHGDTENTETNVRLKKPNLLSLSGILCVGHNMRSVYAPQTQPADV